MVNVHAGRENGLNLLFIHDEAQAKKLQTIWLILIIGTLTLAWRGVLPIIGLVYLLHLLN